MFRPGRLLTICALSLAAIGCENGLTSLTPATPGDRARALFATPDADVRREGINDFAAASFGGEAVYLKLYRMFVTDPDPTVRAACMRALGIHGEPEDALLLANALDDNFDFVRWEAAMALQKIHNPEAADELTAVVTADNDTDVRQAAATALGQYPQPQVFTALVSALDDPEYSVVHAANNALQTLTGQRLDASQTQWLAWSAEHPTQLFADQRPYRWQPYEQPPGLLEKAQFWKDREAAQPQSPRGLESPSMDMQQADAGERS